MADAILDALEARGGRCLVGIPDPAFLALFQRAQQRGFTLLSPHHEAAGGFMAEAAARLTGAPVAVALSPGPGVANALPAMACALAEKAPVLFLGGARGALREPQLRGRFQYGDQMAMVAGVVKHAARIEDPKHAIQTIAEALDAALSGTPGPAYLDCAFPAMLGQAETTILPLPTSATPEPQTLAQAAFLLEQARAPMLLVGHGLSTAARAAAASFARRLGCPVVLTPGASALPGLGPQCFPYAFSPVAGEVIARSDLVLAVGTALGETVHFGRRRHWKAGDEARRWIAITADREAPEANRPIDLTLTGEAELTLRLLEQQLPKLNTRVDLPGWQQAEAARVVAWDDAAQAHPAAPIHPARLVSEAMEALPRDALLVRDGGAGVLFQLSRGGTHEGGVLWSRAFAHLGTGLPYAIGALAAERAMGMAPRPAWLLTGDSALLFHGAELETAVRLGLKIVCVVAADHQWGLEAAAYRQQSGEDAPRPGALWSKATRFDRIARGFGAEGIHVEDAADLPAAFAAAQAAQGPVVIHVAVDAQANGRDLPGWGELASWYSDGMAPAR
ncbi:thiamine pyrophosphate-binding protein [Novosphingobium rosa]|uniref:thiamine pyrophosphate-binding protein n=1 Tax=Novosphingobium rosa TaxID=76978 RepID=UPI000830FE8A|nr:thiamine pyrophosphate-dependent enzyme [Novosphingobium rosa]